MALRESGYWLNDECESILFKVFIKTTNKFFLQDFYTSVYVFSINFFAVLI